MAKKARTNRRKKQGGGDLAFDADGEIEDLPTDHTVADSVSTFDDFYFDDDSAADVDVDDLISTGSAVSNASLAASNRHGKLVDALSGIDELPTEKRAAKRELMLKMTFKALTHYATGVSGRDTVLNYQDHLVQACNFSIRSGSPSEQYAACRVLEAMGVVLGGNQDAYVEEIQPLLERVVKMAGRAPTVRGAALRALSLCHFICSSDDANGPVLYLCESLCQTEFRNHEVPSTLRAIGLDCWSLLATTLHDVYVAGYKDGIADGRGLTMIPLLQGCLEDPSVELRSAAGECLALIHECRLNIGGEEKFSRGSWEGVASVEDRMSEIQQRIADLSTESGRYMSKKVKKQQRATFREFLATLVDDEAPEETISFRGGSVTLTSWHEIIQVNFVRHCLQGGFQIQLLTNETLQMIFGADGRVLNKVDNLSQLEKRLLMSKTSESAKLAHLELTKKRRVRHNVKHDFLTTDDD